MGVDQVSEHDHSSDADGGEDIAPTSVNTERIAKVADTIVQSDVSGSDIQTEFDNLSDGDTIVFGSTTHTVASDQSGAITVKNDDITILLNGTTLESPDQSTSIIDINAHSGVEIRGHGTFLEKSPSNDTTTRRAAVRTDIDADGSDGTGTVDTFRMDGLFVVDGFDSGIIVINVQENALVDGVVARNQQTDAGIGVAAIGSGSTCQNVSVKNCYVDGTDTVETGIEIDSGSADASTVVQDTLIEDCRVTNATKNGIAIESKAEKNVVRDCTSTSNGRRGYHVPNGSNNIANRFVDCVSENNNGSAGSYYGLTAGGDGTQIVRFDSDGDYGAIKINGPAATIEGGDIRNTGSGKGINAQAGATDELLIHGPKMRGLGSLAVVATGPTSVEIHGGYYEDGGMLIGANAKVQGGHILDTGTNISIGYRFKGGAHKVSGIAVEGIGGSPGHGISEDGDAASNSRFIGLEVISVSGDSYNLETSGTLTDVHVTDCVSDSPSGDHVNTNNTQDIRVNGLTFIGGGTKINDNGTRTVEDGLGFNSGDPSSTGDWNGNGYEGVFVRDTTNGDTYLYNNGSWSQVASA
jgi:hypothetical protein